MSEPFKGILHGVGGGWALPTPAAPPPEGVRVSEPKGYAMLGVEYRVMLHRRTYRDPETGEVETVPPNTFYQDSVVVRVEDEAAGPYLVLRGDCDPAGNDRLTPTDIVICDERDVDNLAHALKAILREHATARFDRGVGA